MNLSLIQLVMSEQKKRKKVGWGGARENAGRKSIWKHKETCTMRIPEIFASRLHETAQKWDKEASFEKDTNSKLNELDLVSTKSLEIAPKLPEPENVTKSNAVQMPQLSEAIDLAKEILSHKKSARISLAKFLEKLYSKTVNFEDLQ